MNKQGGQSLGGDKEEKDESKKLQVAATVGVTVALHNAAVEVDGARLKAGEGVSLTARNAGNFNTRSTAASMGLEDSNKGKTIAAAVGVSVNNNKATVDVYSNIDAGGDVDHRRQPDPEPDRHLQGQAGRAVHLRRGVRRQDGEVHLRRDQRAGQPRHHPGQHRRQ